MTLNAGKTRLKLTYTPKGSERVIGWEVPDGMSAAQAVNKLLEENPKGVEFKQFDLHEMTSRGVKIFYF
jgi:hypothetical protein